MPWDVEASVISCMTVVTRFIERPVVYIVLPSWKTTFQRRYIMLSSEKLSNVHISWPTSFEILNYGSICYIQDHHCSQSAVISEYRLKDSVFDVSIFLLISLLFSTALPSALSVFLCLSLACSHPIPLLWEMQKYHSKGQAYCSFMSPLMVIQHRPVIAFTTPPSWSGRPPASRLRT